MKKTMIVSDVIRAILVLLFVLPLSIYSVALVMLLLSLVSVFFTPAQTVALRLLVRKEELLAANAISRYPANHPVSMTLPTAPNAPCALRYENALSAMA